MITENVSTLKVNKMNSKEQYIRIQNEGKVEDTALYLVPDETADLTVYATKEDIADLEESKQDASTAINTDNIANQSVSHANTADSLTGVTATATELNVLDGITASTAELNYMDGVTSPVQTQLDGLNSNLDDTENVVEKIRSHVGMIIHSTTLDTMAKVIAIYGGTTWVKIEGRMLLGQSSSYGINTTGGSATNTLTTANLPSHAHSVGAHSHGLNSHTHSVGAHAHGLNSHTHNIPALSGSTNENGSHQHTLWAEDGYTNSWHDVGGVCVSNDQGVPNAYHVAMAVYGDCVWNPKTDVSSNHSHTVTTNVNTTGAPSTKSTANSSVFNTGAPSTGSTANSSAFNSGNTGSGTAVNNMPPYKTVYIWERTA